MGPSTDSLIDSISDLTHGFHINPRQQNDEQVKRIVATRRRGARLKALHDLCKGSTKRMCTGTKPPEGVDPIMGAEMAGCGTMQVCGAGNWLVWVVGVGLDHSVHLFTRLLLFRSFSCQPTYRREGLRVTAIFPEAVEGAPRDPDRKQVRWLD